MLEVSHSPDESIPNAADTQESLRPVSITTLQLVTKFPIRHRAVHLRGFFGNRFPEFTLTHNHTADGRRIQGYPLIQYKILGNKAYIVGLNEGAKLLSFLTKDLQEITLGATRYPIVHQKLVTQSVAIGGTRRPMYYQFVHPWVALNPTNYRKYRSLYDWKARKSLLNRILVGNCLSLARALEIFVPYKLFAHTHLDPVEVNFKNTLLTGFVGRFKVNFQLHDLMGIGKGVSRGFGTTLLMPSQKKYHLPVELSENIIDDVSELDTSTISSSQ